MKCLLARISLLLILFPVLSYAGWQVAKPSDSQDAFFQNSGSESATKSPESATFPDQFANLGRPQSQYAISVSGSLKENIERIMDRYHWKVIWQVAFDYNFDGKVTGSSLPNVMEKLLSPFPLQAKLYLSNRTMIVTPRTI